MGGLVHFSKGGKLPTQDARTLASPRPPPCFLRRPPCWARVHEEWRREGYGRSNVLSQGGGSRRPQSLASKPVTLVHGDGCPTPAWCAFLCWAHLILPLFNGGVVAPPSPPFPSVVIRSTPFFRLALPLLFLPPGQCVSPSKALFPPPATHPSLFSSPLPRILGARDGRRSASRHFSFWARRISLLRTRERTGRKRKQRGAPNLLEFGWGHSLTNTDGHPPLSVSSPLPSTASEWVRGVSPFMEFFLPPPRFFLCLVASGAL